MNSSEPSFCPRGYRLRKVCHLDLYLARFQVQDLFSPRYRHGSWVRRTLACTLECSESICALHTTGNDLASEMRTPRQRHGSCNSRVAIANQCSHFLSMIFLMAFSTLASDAESYFGGACAVALTPKRSFSSLITASRNENTAGSVCDLTTSSRKPVCSTTRQFLSTAAWSSTPLHCTSMLQMIMPGLTFTQNGVAPLVSSPSTPSVKNPVYACHRKIVLFFTLSLVSVRPPSATNTSTAPIEIWTVISCFVCSNP